jgi:hypothetical protein
MCNSHTAYKVHLAEAAYGRHESRIGSQRALVKKLRLIHSFRTTLHTQTHTYPNLGHDMPTYSRLLAYVVARRPYTRVVWCDVIIFVHKGASPEKLQIPSTLEPKLRDGMRTLVTKSMTSEVDDDQLHNTQTYCGTRLLRNLINSHFSPLATCLLDHCASALQEDQPRLQQGL